MRIEDFTILYNYLCEAYAKTTSDSQLMIWYDFFKEYDAETFKNAIIQYINENKFFPSISDIKTIITKQTNTEAGLKADEEYEKVIDAIREYGWCNEEKALETLNPLTRNIVERIGYQDMCQADIQRKYVLRSAFIKAFESEQNDIIRYNGSNTKDTLEMQLIQERNKNLLTNLTGGLIKKIDD